MLKPLTDLSNELGFYVVHSIELPKVRWPSYFDRERLGRQKLKYLISVDSETGVYWHGARELRTQAQVDAVIKQAVNEDASVDNCAMRGQTPYYYFAMKAIRTTASYFSVRSLQFK